MNVPDDVTTIEFLGFRHRFVSADGLRFHTVQGGSGPLVVLLAGFPQSWYAWRRVMPLLAQNHSVVAIDLPGQGDSDKPVGGYDTRTTARRVRSLVATLGYERYLLAGHDIGAWVSYPYAAEFPAELRGVVLLDANIPGITLSPTIDLALDNWRNWHFLFNPIPDLPEALLSGRERILIEWFFHRKTANPVGTFSRADIDEYERAYRMPGGLRGMLGYYRAVLEDMEQNREIGQQRLKPPVLALGGDVGSAPNIFEALKPFCENVRGGLIADSGHYVPEEQPDALAREMLKFFATLSD